MEQGYRQVLFHPTSGQTGWDHPRIVSMGGDHSIVLPVLRSLKSVYGPISVIHLDSHLDTYVQVLFPHTYIYIYMKDKQIENYCG